MFLIKVALTHQHFIFIFGGKRILTSCESQQKGQSDKQISKGIYYMYYNKTDQYTPIYKVALGMTCCHPYRLCPKKKNVQIAVGKKQCVQS